MNHPFNRSIAPFLFILSAPIFHSRFEIDQIYRHIVIINIQLLISVIVLIIHPIVLLNIKLKILAKKLSRFIKGSSKIR